MKVFYLCIVLIASSFSSAFAGSEAKIFIPNTYAPLSSFQEKTSTTASVLQFSVSVKVLTYIQSNAFSKWVAHQDASGKISLLAPSSLDLTKGLVTLSTSLSGKFVFVAEPFTNDYPIVTHWKQSLNSGRGGFSAGASDAIGVLDYYPEADFAGENTDLFDNDPASPFTFNTKKYALFSSDPTDPHARVPGTDRYVGENYSISKITDRLAVYQSLKAVEATGFPLIHRNHPWAFTSSLSRTKRVMQNIPAFQVVHAVVVEPEPGKSSLATFILPPAWVSNPSVKYPILFTGLYDLHQNYIWGNGFDFVKIIADLSKNKVGNAVGILWNGGGAFASQTMQLSTYFNVAYLFFMAQNLVGVDLQKIVTAGISRGAQTAINVAANPFFNNYKVSYALAWCLPSAMGEHATTWLGTNYPGAFVNLAWGTGYKYSYKTSFIDPVTGLGNSSLFLNNVTGSTEPWFANEISPIGDWLLSGLKEKGTSVYMSLGTNDAYLPFDPQLRVYNRMKELGIPAALDIGYRFGHNFVDDKNKVIMKAMTELMTGTRKPFTGITHFKRSSTTPQVAEVFQPQRTFFTELPSIVVRGKSMRLVAAGSAALNYVIFFTKIDDQAWNNQKIIQKIGEPMILKVGVFYNLDSIQSQPFDIHVASDMPLGKYIVQAGISSDNGNSWTLVDKTSNFSPADLGFYVFEVLANEPTLPASELAPTLVKDGIGGGLSTH